MGNALDRNNRIRIGPKAALGLLGPYIRTRVLDQVKSVWLIIVYLVLFQTLVLNIPVAQGALIGIGVALVVGGLTFFMEGLVLGLMPLGERVGIRLPQRVGIVAVVFFAFLLGLLATMAEPAIQVLQAAGNSVDAWQAPLLFLLLNQYADLLVLSVGGGVGLAVALGMVRFYRSWSLKPPILILVGSLLGVTAWTYFDPNLRTIAGLAWDCGAVTTGPVTVPLVLALGVGISRMVGTSESGTSGFGVVTLASLFPILAVYLLGLTLVSSVPRPMDEAAFFDSRHRDRALTLFESESHLAAYALLRAGSDGRDAFFGADPQKRDRFARSLFEDDARRRSLKAVDRERLAQWIGEHGSPALRQDFARRTGAAPDGGAAGPRVDGRTLLIRNLVSAFKAIGLLTAPLLLVMLVILRERVPRMDEILLGLGFAVIGLCVFSIGIEIGLDRLGKQVGRMLPASFRSVTIAPQATTICPFDPQLVQTAVAPDGTPRHFFFELDGKEVRTVPYREENLDPDSGCYRFWETRGPLYGHEGLPWGFAVVLLFAFVMGYGATIAEPALNALGRTVEELTVGTFRKTLLMQSVALGVGFGLVAGVSKIIWDLPLAWLLIPSYSILLVVTLISSEEFVNVAWDSAGVTTGPITVPLVLAMGLGIGSQVGVVEGFGILAAASVFPILSVLCVGLYLNRVRKRVLQEEPELPAEGQALHG